MKEKKRWKADVSGTPVWRDGLTSKMSYAIVAAHKKAEGYSCVCMRPMGDVNKVKFYPDLATWGLTTADLKDLGFESFLDRTDDDSTHYFRVVGSMEAVNKLLELLGKTRNVAAITENMVPDILVGKGKEKSPHPPGVRIPLKV